MTPNKEEKEKWYEMLLLFKVFKIWWESNLRAFEDDRNKMINY